MNQKVHEFLVEWAMNFIKNKDVFAKKILSIGKSNNGFDIDIKYKDKEQFALVLEDFGDFDSISGKLNQDKSLSIFTLNSKENLDFLTKNWKKFLDYRHLTIIFTNPFSNLDKKWIISPYVHSRICDEGSLSLGLKSMFEMVEEIDENKCISRIGSNK